MADDPRELSPAEWLRRPAFNPLNPVADRAPQPDPLRALLADEDRFVQVASAAIHNATIESSRDALCAVLAALREVAGL